MHNLNRAAFRQVVFEAQKTKKQLRELLEHNQYLDYPQVLTVAVAIERALLSSNPDLDKAETRRFAEIVCGAADRINAEAVIDAKEIIPNETKMFRNTKRSVMLDQRYDIQNKLTTVYKALLESWIEKGCPDDEKLHIMINYYHSYAAAAKHCDPLVQKDIEAHILQKTIVMDNSDMTDKHQQELDALARNAVNSC